MVRKALSYPDKPGGLYTSIIIRRRYKPPRFWGEIQKSTPIPTVAYSLGGLIMIWARWVPGSIIHGIPGTSGFKAKPVVSAVAQGI